MDRASRERAIIDPMVEEIRRDGRFSYQGTQALAAVTYLGGIEAAFDSSSVENFKQRFYGLIEDKCRINEESSFFIRRGFEGAIIAVRLEIAEAIKEKDVWQVARGYNCLEDRDFFSIDSGYEQNHSSISLSLIPGFRGRILKKFNLI